ncbi:hypothetical protein GCM10020220_068010 [Nonomuraea rubra]|uniref:hypothetical protein n=1 Tax=Nonomuraea rubra TaxID=46180 RepID=UPI0031E79187
MPGAVLAGVAVVTGLLGPALTGGWTAQLPLVAGAGRLGRATAFDSMSYNVAGLAGPALVGVIASAGGGVMAALVSVGMLVAALPAAHGLPSPDPRPADGDGGARPAGGEGGSRPAGGDGGVAGWRVVREEVRAGFRAIVSNGTLRRATVASMVSCCGWPWWSCRPRCSVPG